MTSFPGSPRLLKGGIVLIDPETGNIQRIITMQYNPDTLSRTLQVQGVGEGGDRSEALRLKGPPVETIKLDAELDAVDREELANPASPGTITPEQLSIHSQLAALETIVYPASSSLLENNRLAQSGTLEIAPMQAPLTLFIWSRSRILPVRLTEFGITEEAFDTMLNPIRAKVSLGMRVLSVNDLGFAHKGSSLFMAYHQQKESLASRVKGSLSAFGIGGNL